MPSTSGTSANSAMQHFRQLYIQFLLYTVPDRSLKSQIPTERSMLVVLYNTLHQWEQGTF